MQTGQTHLSGYLLVAHSSLMSHDSIGYTFICSWQSHKLQIDDDSEKLMAGNGCCVMGPDKFCSCDGLLCLAVVLVEIVPDSVGDSPQT